MKQLFVIFPRTCIIRITLLIFTFLTAQAASGAMSSSPVLTDFLAKQISYAQNNTTLIQPSPSAPLLQNRRLFFGLGPVVALPLLFGTWWWLQHRNLTALRSPKEVDNTYQNLQNQSIIYTMSTQEINKLDQEAIDCLGFNPKITIRQQTETENHDTIMVSGYGWGADQAGKHPWIYWAAQWSKTDLCSFDFHDCGSAYDVNVLINWHRITYANFGTTHDMETLLFVFKTCVKKGYTTIHGMYHSRSGATWLRAINAIYHPKDQDINLWKKSGLTKANTDDVDYETITTIQKALAQGATVLIQPWFDTEATFNELEKGLDHLLSFISPASLRTGRKPFHWLLETFTCYNSHLSSGINLLEKIARNSSNEKYPSLTITVAENDKTIGNEHLAKLENMNKLGLITIIEEPIKNDPKTHKPDGDTILTLAPSLKTPTKITIVKHEGNHSHFETGSTILQYQMKEKSPLTTVEKI